MCNLEGDVDSKCSFFKKTGVNYKMFYAEDNSLKKRIVLREERVVKLGLRSLIRDGSKNTHRS